MSKTFSKTTIASLIVSLVVAVGVSAVGNDVLTLEAEQNETTGEIVFSGTTDDSVVAVSCILSDKTGEEIMFGSAEVENAAFGGSFEMPVDGYTLKCANYDGGDWVSIEIGDISEDKEPGEEEEDGSESPDTGKLTNEEGVSATINFTPLITSAAILFAILIVSAIVSRKRNTKE